MALFTSSARAAPVCARRNAASVGGSSGEALRGGRAAGRLEPKLRSPPLLPRGAPFAWVWDSPSSRYCLVQDSGSSRRELHRKTRTFASARLNLIYDERPLSLCGADGFPPPTHPIAGRLTRFFSEEALGVAVLPPTPNHSHTYCSQAICAAAPSPAAERGLRAGSPAVRTPAGSPRCSRPGDSPAATSFCTGLQTVSREECAHQDRDSIDQESKCFRERCLGWFCRARPFSNTSVGSGIQSLLPFLRR